VDQGYSRYQISILDITGAKDDRLQNDLYCVEWDVKLYYTIPAKDEVLVTTGAI